MEDCNLTNIVFCRDQFVLLRTNMHYDAQYNINHLFGYLHNSHRLYFLYVILITILPTHKNNVCLCNIIIIVLKDRDLK